MQLTNEQEKALKIILNKYNNHEKYVTVSGFAGVGKSTLVRFAIEALDVDEDRVAYACFCGKAAEVLRKKGNKNAITLHRLLYESIPRPGGGFLRKPRLGLDYDIIVVDEISLAPKSMIDLLLSHNNIFCIFIGDNFQLPQIDKNEAHTFLNHPDIFLSTVMRQATESEIIQLTMKIRNQEDISFMKGNEVIVAPKKDLVTGHMLWADTILCATNATRHNINKQMRDLLGFQGNIQENEKVICKRNYWDIINEDGDALVNGTIGTIKNIYESYINIPSFIQNDRHRIPIYGCDLIPEYGKEFSNISLDQDYLIDETPCVDWRISYKLGKMKKADILPQQITYGYSLTVHCAQGSEWDKVLVLEESFPFDRIEHARWLYTACTRASSKLVLLR